MTQPNGSGEMAWIVTTDTRLAERIAPLLLPTYRRVQVIDADEFGLESFWHPRPTTPRLVILDIEQRLDWGALSIQRLRQARIHAPVVVITRDFSHEFGAKILSEGIKYYLAHDFCDQELQDLAESLLRQHPSVSER